MYILIIKHQGKILQEIQIKKDIIYHVGRNKSNQIVLPEEAGISRKHLEICLQNDEKLMVKNLSPVSTVNIGGTDTNEGELEPGQAFQLQNYEFLFKKSEEIREESQKQNIILSGKSQSKKITEQKTDDLSKSQDLVHRASKTPGLTNKDKTTVIPVEENDKKLSAYLKISTDEKSAQDIFKLKDQSAWSIGRDPSCDLVIDNANISRTHFKITKEGNNFFITDLKSSNGTLLNDKELKSQKSYSLESGDMIYILDIEILFEIRSPSLQQEIALLKPVPLPTQASVEMPSPANLVPFYPPPPPLLPDGAPNLIAEGEEEKPQSRFAFLRSKRVLIYGTILLLTGVFLLPDKKNNTAEQGKPVVQNQGILAGLTEQQQQIVKDTYQVAQQLYSQGKYEYCRSEIQKLHKYTDSYKQSKRLEIECAQAAENQRRQIELEQKHKKAAKTEAFIQRITDKCQAEFHSFLVKSALVDCLAPAIELEPADSRIQVLIDQFDANEIAKEEKRKKQAQRKAKIQSILRKYRQSKKLHKDGKTEQAISSYKNFIKISQYRELEDTRQQAERELANIKKEFDDGIQKLNSECDNRFKEKQLKEAYYVCRKASKTIPPSRNQHVISIMNQSRNQLQIRMKPLYEEASINESVGNITIAKEYWQKIIQQDVDAGLYYKMAQAKLDKY